MKNDARHGYRSFSGIREPKSSKDFGAISFKEIAAARSKGTTQ
jgi:hypothetical protein